jgi:hypothetical protein
MHICVLEKFSHRLLLHGSRVKEREGYGKEEKREEIERERESSELIQKVLIIIRDILLLSCL